MSARDENSKSQPADQEELVRQIEARLPNAPVAEESLTPWQYALTASVGGSVFLLWLVWTATWPVPRGKENRDQAAAFLEQQFPGRTLTPNATEDATAAVAALFYVIRYGDHHHATKAIHFAAGQEFGFASPYVIERLESDDRELRRAARHFLTKMAGRDLGPTAETWEEWWRDPPRSLLGVLTVGHDAFQLAIPVSSLLVGLVLYATGSRLSRDSVTFGGTVLLVVGWFGLFMTLGLRYFGDFETCRFGGTEIVYHQCQGVVEGLGDAKIGGVGLLLFVLAAGVGFPFVVAVLFVIFGAWRWGNIDQPQGATETK